MELASFLAQLAALPHLGWLAVYGPTIAFITVTVCSFVATKMAAPTQATGGYYWIYTLVNWGALSFGHAQSLSAPASNGLVGGPTAISAPRIATTSVPVLPTK